MKLLEVLGSKFTKEDFTIALQAPSWANENKKESYERLEFLGDSVLNLVVSQYLYQTYKTAKPGELTELRKKFVNNKTNLCAVFDVLDLTGFVKVKKDDLSAKVKADFVEAIIGAVYVKSPAACEQFIKTIILKI